MKLLGEFIKESRTKKGLSLRDLATLADISPAQVSKLERGLVKNPTDSTLDRIAEVLNVDKYDFFALAGRAYDDEENIQDSIMALLNELQYPVYTSAPETFTIVSDSTSSYPVAHLADNFRDSIKTLLLKYYPALQEDHAAAAAREMEAAFELWKKREGYKLGGQLDAFGYPIKRD